VSRANFPSTEGNSVWSANLEIFAVRRDLQELRVRLFDVRRCEFTPNRMQESRAGEPSTDSRKQWREQQENQQDPAFRFAGT